MRYLKHYLKIWLTGIIILTVFTTFSAIAGGKMNKFPAENFFEPPVVKLLYRLQRGDTAAAKKQLASGVSLNVIGNQGITPLFWLLINEDKKTAQLALNMGADPNFADEKGRSPVYILAESIWTDWLKMVLEAGGNPNEQEKPEDGGEPVLFSAIGGLKPLEHTKVLVDYGADINLKDNSGIDSILYSAYVTEYGVTLWLAENGADICTKDTLGGTVAWFVQDRIKVNKDFGRPDSEDLLKLRDLLISRGAYPPGPGSLCN